MTMAVAGMAAGCLLGYAIAIYLAESWLDEYSTLVAQQQDAASEEATKALASIKASPHPACSDAELAYLKDAGRIHGGKIDCSATADRPGRSIGQFAPEFSQQDGTVAYSNLLPIRDPGLKRAGLQLGNAYVVFAPQEPASLGHIPMRLIFTMNPPSSQTPAAPVAPVAPVAAARGPQPPPRFPRRFRAKAAWLWAEPYSVAFQAAFWA